MEESDKAGVTDLPGDLPTHGRTFILIYGLLLIVVALIAMFDPLATGFAIGILLGVMLVFYGVLALGAGFSSLPHHGRAIEIILGALAILAAIVLIFDPFAGAISLVWVIGVWLIISGISHIVYLRSAPHDRGWRLFMGIVDIILGAYLFFSGPATALIFLSFLVGISFFLRGVFLLVLASKLKPKLSA